MAELRVLLVRHDLPFAECMEQARDPRRVPDLARALLQAGVGRADVRRLLEQVPAVLWRADPARYVDAVLSRLPDRAAEEET
jgi:hypothetical protein